MPSSYLGEDLDEVKKHYAPLINARAKSQMWRTLFYMAATILLLIVLVVCTLACITYCKRRGERDEYLTV